MFSAITILAALLAAPLHPAATSPADDTPTAQHVTAKPAATPLCSIRSSSGNCYAAGEYCREADLGKTTTDADGQPITCGTESGKPHWQYSAAAD